MTDHTPSTAGEAGTVVDADAIPAALKNKEQWVCWQEKVRDGKPTKVPINPDAEGYASVTDSATWTDLDTALQYYRQTRPVDGIEFVFREDGPYAGVDLDDCRNPETGTVAKWAGDIVAQLDSYTERSPSGTGLHILVEGALPAGGARSGDVELYDRARYFTVTGDRVLGTPQTVESRSAVLQGIYDQYVDTSDEPADSAGVARSDQSGKPTYGDQAVIERACTAANGDRFERLWTGDTTGYDSHSEADMALCCYLAFWTGGDAAQIDRLFRQSGLMREKWDTVHYSDGSTYGEKTVRRALTFVDDGYTK